MRVLEAAGRLRRQLDGVIAALAADVEARRLSSNEAGIARTQGFRSSAEYVAHTVRVSTTEGRRFIQVGSASSGRRLFTGERAQAATPHVAEAMGSGEIGLAAASEIVSFYDRARFVAGPDDVETAEKVLVDLAAEVTLPELRKAILHTEAWIDPDGLEPKIDKQRKARALRFGTDATGMVTMTARLDPETAAPIKTAIEAMVTHQLRASRGHNVKLSTGDYLRGPHRFADAEASEAADAAAESSPQRESSTSSVHFAPTVPDVDDNLQGTNLGAEHRSIVQLQADALATLCRHTLGCEAKELAGTASTTVVVRMPLEALSDEAAADIGAVGGPVNCEIDGQGPIDVSTARKMAAAAGIIPLVLGGDSVVLDLGRARRFFTPAQRLALVERDGGCAFCGLPPGMTEAHHIKWWTRDHGPTDLSNGILLCTTCHHRVHEGWEVHVVPDSDGQPGSGGTVWFVPESLIDGARTPRLGGRKRFDPAYRQANPPTPLPSPPKLPPRVVQSSSVSAVDRGESLWNSSLQVARERVTNSSDSADAHGGAMPGGGVGSTDRRAQDVERVRAVTPEHGRTANTGRANNNSASIERAAPVGVSAWPGSSSAPAPAVTPTGDSEPLAPWGWPREAQRRAASNQARRDVSNAREPKLTRRLTTKRSTPNVDRRWGQRFERLLDECPEELLPIGTIPVKRISYAALIRKPRQMRPAAARSRTKIAVRTTRLPARYVDRQ